MGIEADKPKQKEHEVKAGDRMSSIAHEHGFKDYHALYLAQSEAFRKKRPNPEILLPGDKVVLPDKVEEKHAAKDKKAQKYEDDTELPELRLYLKIAGKALASKTVSVTIETAPYSKAAPFKGNVTTGADGLAVFKVKPEVREVVIACSAPLFQAKLMVGHLRPASEAGGVEQRLDNLNYRVPIAAATAPADSEAEKKAKQAQERLVKKAAARFQEDGKKGGDGSVNDALRALLIKAHEP